MTGLAIGITVGIALVLGVAALAYHRSRVHAAARAQLGRIEGELDRDALRRVVDDAHHNRHPELGRVTGRHDAADIRRTIDEARRSSLAEAG